MPETVSVDGGKIPSVDDDNFFMNEELSTKGHVDVAVELDETKENLQTKRTSSLSQRNSRSSVLLKLRKLPPQLQVGDETILGFFPDETSETDDENDGAKNEINEKKPRFDLLQMTCLRPTFSLRKQIILAFGTPIALTIFFVMIASIIFTVMVTTSITSEARSDVTTVTRTISRNSPRYVAEDLSLRMPLALPLLIAEVVMDRFAGYPHHAGYEDDTAVPFFDITTQRNSYPLNATATLPLHWQIDPNVNGDNYQEHVQHRWSWGMRSYQGRRLH
eukprot:5737408-Ditylum_brightwellii.AAC.1